MSELKQRTSSSKQQPPPGTSSSESDSDALQPLTQVTQPPQNRSAVSQTLASTAYLANLLPTGTLLAFQLLTPIFTNNGTCDTVTSVLTVILLVFLATSCFTASFTDSFRASDGQVYYGLATFKGMWLFDYPGDEASSGFPDLTRYRIRIIDWIHALLSMLVFGVVALRDRNVVSCLYPRPSHEVQEVLDIVPIGVGVLCGLLFVVFPTKRHGIGYPVTGASKSLASAFQMTRLTKRRRTSREEEPDVRGTYNPDVRRSGSPRVLQEERRARTAFEEGRLRAILSG